MRASACGEGDAIPPKAAKNRPSGYKWLWYNWLRDAGSPGLNTLQPNQGSVLRFAGWPSHRLTQAQNSMPNGVRAA